MKLVDDFWRDITALGGFGFYFLAIITILLLDQGKEALRLLLGFVISGAAVAVIRIVYFKPRPDVQQHHTLLEKIDAASFPSWHAARIVFLAIEGSVLFDNGFLTFFLAVLALLVGYSRIYVRKHDGVDVLGGMMLGALTWWIVEIIV